MTEIPNWLAALRAYLLTVAMADLSWEAAHLPLYTLWQTGTVGENIFVVIHCTFGDLLIALASLILALVLIGDRDWPVRRFGPVVALTVIFGFGYTVFSEWLNVVVRKSWDYSSLMPIISVAGLRLGASPLLQWIIAPLIAFFVVRRIGVSRGPRLKEFCPEREPR